MYESELKEQLTIKEKLTSSYREDYPVSEHTREGGKVSVKAHERGEKKELKIEELNKEEKKVFYKATRKSLLERDDELYLLEKWHGEQYNIISDAHPLSQYKKEEERKEREKFFIPLKKEYEKKKELIHQKHENFKLKTLKKILNSY